MDSFRRLLDKCGPGGVKCSCCNYRNKKKKCRKHSRWVRRVLKQKDKFEE